MRRAAKVDANHAEIVKAFRNAGCLVRSLASVGEGFPDLLVWSPWMNGCRLCLVEVKTLKGKPTPDQVRFQGEGWPVRTVRSVAEAIELATDRNAGLARIGR